MSRLPTTAFISILVFAGTGVPAAHADGTCILNGQQIPVPVPDAEFCQLECQTAPSPLAVCNYIPHHQGDNVQRAGTNVSSYKVCNDSSNAWTSGLQMPGSMVKASNTAQIPPGQAGAMLALVDPGYKVVTSVCGAWKEDEKKDVGVGDTGHLCPFQGSCGNLKHDGGEFDFVGYFEDQGAGIVEAYVQNDTGEGIYAKVMLIEIPR
jgi:hypothetical protein